MVCTRQFYMGVILCTVLGSFSHAAIPLKALTDAPNIIRITSDSLIIASGTTMRFSVDSPEDQGAVSTGLHVENLTSQLDMGEAQYAVYDSAKTLKGEGELKNGDILHVIDGEKERIYSVGTEKKALNATLVLHRDTVRTDAEGNLVLYFTAGQRSPQTQIRLYVPSGIYVTMDNTTVNVIGRGEVKLSDLEKQSIGRVGTNYSYSKVGKVSIADRGKGGQVITFSGIDLRPLNGFDLRLCIKKMKIEKEGDYLFRASYTATKPEIYNSTETEAKLSVISTVADFGRTFADIQPHCETFDYTSVTFNWTAVSRASKISLLQSIDGEKTWATSSSVISPGDTSVVVKNLQPNKLYAFKLDVEGGKNKGFSNVAYFYSGKWDVKQFGVVADGGHDNTDKINEAITYLNRLGGGTLLFSEGTFNVRTVHLKSNVYLYIEKGATIKAIKSSDAPELTWFSDKKYRSGLSPTSTGPYRDPENYMTKQDVGHTYFRNTMFFGERIDNVKIIGNGRITGDGYLNTSDKVMNNDPDKRADKMFSLKLCTNIEIGGIARDEDLWYDSKSDVPYYINMDGSKNYDCDNMLNIDRGGHFVLLATGTDNILVHDTYFGKHSTSNVRDIYDFMSCSNVDVVNVYCKVSSDDIVKLGSDCSLGFTRPGKNYKVRNIIGDTNCNLFQIGSETADDITDVCVGNIYVLGANKAGFSISTNDGGHVKNIHLNCGHTGKLHSRSEMYRTRTPFFISISNRGRVLGADVKRFKFSENGETRDELLCTNVNIGVVENIILSGVDICEVYGGSSFRGSRWKEYDGSQRRSTPIVAGYALPHTKHVEGGLNFKLPNAKHTGYITNVSFNDVHVLVKGGNPLSDSEISPMELGVGQYNVSNLGIQPSYGLWIRHAKNLNVINCSFNYENRDSRFALFLDDVHVAKIDNVKMVKATENTQAIKTIGSSGVSVVNSVFYNDKWGTNPKVVSCFE